MAVRTHCPSCRHRLSPFAVECPECGLPLGRQALPRPLLFQASAIQGTPLPEPRPQQALRAPALGRVVPVDLVPAEDPGASGELAALPDAESPSLLASPAPRAEEDAGDATFWPLVGVELRDGLMLLALNGLLALLVRLHLGLPLAEAYRGLWVFLLPVHAALAWCAVMVPLALTGQSLAMARAGFVLDTTQPERRLSFSVFHLLSALCFPLSFLCMVLTPEHRSLAELLTGQELMRRPSRMR